MRRWPIVLALVACSYDEAPLDCAWLSPAGNVDELAGGSYASLNEMRSAMDFAGVAATSALQLATICTQVASSLGVSQESIDPAFTSTNQDVQMTSICKLAADAVAQARGGDAVALNATVPTCVVSTAFPASCRNACIPASDACATACDAAARANAECPEPRVAASGASSAPLADVLSTHFGAVLALRARLALLNESGGPLGASVAKITDTSYACRPVVRDRVASANVRVAASQKAIDALVSAAGGQ